MDKIYVTGHKNPDTDSICSAIAYSNFKKLQGNDSCVPARLGPVNKETEFVLNYFGVPEPQLIESVKTQVSDIEYEKIEMVYPHITIKQVWETIKSTQNKFLPIIDSPEERKMVGLISLGDITRFNMENFREDSLSKFNTTFYNLAEVINAEILSGNDLLFDTIKGRLLSCVCPEDYNNIDNETVIVGRENLDLEKIFKTDVKCVILTQGYKVKSIPKTFKGIVMATAFSLFNIIRDISLAVSIGEIMKTKDIVYFNESDFVDDIKDIMIKWRFRSFPILDASNNAIGTLSRRHLLNVKNKKVILVDHNEKSQSVHGLEQAHILEIIDHHRVGDIQTNYPIYVRNEPVGCTATIIAAMYLDNDLLPDKKTAGLLLSAIISDTLLFQSPTCTDTDKLMAQKLSAVAELKIEEYGKAMLHAGTQLEGKTVEELFKIDFKEFSFNKYHFAVAQINTANLEKMQERKDEFLAHLRKISEERGYNITAFMITDIISGGSEILYAGEAIAVMKEVFNSASEETTGFLPGVISRKKQVIPQILNKLSYF